MKRRVRAFLPSVFPLSPVAASFLDRLPALSGLGEKLRVFFSLLNYRFDFLLCEMAAASFDLSVSASALDLTLTGSNNAPFW